MPWRVCDPEAVGFRVYCLRIETKREAFVEIRYQQLHAAAALTQRTAIVDIYRRAFGPPPYSKDEIVIQGFGEVFQRHAFNPGFRCVVAYADHGLCGFVYGYTSRPGQWWRDTVTHGLPRSVVTRWFKNCFEFVELAVTPEWQGHGIGGQLHDRVLQGLPHHTAALSTLHQETIGARLYQSRGWVTLADPFFFPQIEEPYRIMGKQLRES